jgi:hypothetical protein
MRKNSGANLAGQRGPFFRVMRQSSKIGAKKVFFSFGLQVRFGLVAVDSKAFPRRERGNDEINARAAPHLREPD